MTVPSRSIWGALLSWSVLATSLLAWTACGDAGDATDLDSGSMLRDGSMAGDADVTGDGGVLTVPPPLALTPCVPSGSGMDYQVGPGAGQLASLALVPWESLGPGDTVRIFYSATPYAGKFSITAHGTEMAPVRVCGVTGPNGERPIIDGANAPTRAAISYGRDSASAINQTRGLVMIIATGPEEGVDQPTWVQVDGLKLQRAHPDYNFTDTAGAQHAYTDFGACIWVERGHHITIADNEMTDCTHAILSRSQDGDPPVQTQDLRIAGNYMHGNGVAGAQGIHTNYIQSVRVIYEFNRYGALRAGALGNSIKDRSIGTVIRYNRIEEGAHAIDLVESEDFPTVAMADPAYRTTFVYGNQIRKDGTSGTSIHYGGDHPGSEANYRRGTLYFFNNTVQLTGTGAVVLFQLSTTEEHAEVFNNVFLFDASVQYPAMRGGQDNATGYTSGGILNLGKNWIDARWADSDPYHMVTGQLNGSANMITGTTSPLDANNVPLAGSAVVDTAQAAVGPSAAHPVSFELDANYLATPRALVGAAQDIGAVERP